MQLIEKKVKEQNKALQRWIANKCIGSVIAATGFGKTKLTTMAVDYVFKAVIKNLKREPKGIILVPTVQLQSQTAEEFVKWGLGAYLEFIDIVCYASSHTIQGKEYDIIIADEVHLGLTELKREFFSANKYKTLLCLTATEPEDPEYNGILFELAPKVYEMGLDEAVQMGLIAPYKLYCIPINFTQEEAKSYSKANNSFIYNKMKLGYGGFSTAQSILAGTIQGDKGAAAGYFNAIRKRKTLIQNAENKITACKKIVKACPDSRILIFGGLNEFTDSIAEAVDAVSYHSKKTSKQREEVLRQYKERESNVLCSTKALNQGFDVPDSDLGIIAGLDSKALPMIQRIGRLLRLVEGKTATIIILYIPNSQEETWMKKATESLSNVNYLNSLEEWLQPSKQDDSQKKRN